MVGMLANRPVADLHLHEQRVEPVLDQMRDVAVTQRGRGQLARETELVAIGREPLGDVRRGHASAALGQPQRGMLLASVKRADLPTCPAYRP